MSNDPRKPDFAVSPNADTIQNASVPLQIAGVAYQLPDMPIPDGMSVLIKSWPKNGGYVYVGATKPDATDPSKCWPLQPGEFVGYRIKNANALWVSGTVAKDLVIISAEKNQRG